MLARLGVIAYPVRLNGRGPFRCEFDTGANGLFVLPAACEALGLKPTESGAVSAGGDASRRLAKFTLRQFSVGDTTFPEQEGYRAPTPALAPYECIAGGVFLRRFAVRVDLDACRMQLIEQGDFSYHGAGRRLHLLLTADGTPLVTANVDGVPGVFAVDTGYTGDVFVNSTFARAHGLPKPAARRLVDRAAGLTGLQPIVSFRVDSLGLGGFSLARPVADTSLFRDGDRRDADGMIGMGVLRRFNVVYDAAHDSLYLEPRPCLHDPFPSNRLGMALGGAGERLQVLEVFPGGAAERAGVQQGDEVLAVNGVRVRPGNFARQAALYGSRVGVKILFKLRRRGRVRTVQLTCRETL